MNRRRSSIHGQSIDYIQSTRPLYAPLAAPRGVQQTASYVTRPNVVRDIERDGGGTVNETEAEAEVEVEATH